MNVISGHCGGGNHNQCVGRAPTDAGMWVHCACQEPSCLCTQEEAARTRTAGIRPAGEFP